MRKNVQTQRLLDALVGSCLGIQHRQPDAHEKRHCQSWSNQRRHTPSKPSEKIVIIERRRERSALTQANFAPNILIEISGGTGHYFCPVGTEKLVQIVRVHI